MVIARYQPNGMLAFFRQMRERDAAVPVRIGRE